MVCLVRNQAFIFCNKYMLRRQTVGVFVLVINFVSKRNDNFTSLYIDLKIMKKTRVSLKIGFQMKIHRLIGTWMYVSILLKQVSIGRVIILSYHYLGLQGKTAKSISQFLFYEKLKLLCTSMVSNSSSSFTDWATSCLTSFFLLFLAALINC